MCCCARFCDNFDPFDVVVELDVIPSVRDFGTILFLFMLGRS